MTAGVLFEAAPWVATEIDEPQLPRLQRFFDDNPAYFLAIQGRPAGPDEARLEFDDRPPEGMPFDRRWLLGLADPAQPDGPLLGMAHVLKDLLAPQVWHVGLFIVATALHRTGASRRMYQALEAWMQQGGAHWIRLGVVLGNAPAERFWEACGFTELRRREQVWTGTQAHTIRVMAKRLNGAGDLAGDFSDYLARVPRDQPGSMLP